MADEDTTEDTTENVGGGQTTDESSPNVQAQEERNASGVGGQGGDPETRLTILTAHEMDWFFDKSTGKWYVRYGLRGSNKGLLFEATPEQMDSLFGTNRRPTDFKRRSMAELVKRPNVIFGGSIASMEGKGRFEDEVKRIKALAMDNGDLPDWMGNGQEVMDIVFLAQAANKGDEWMLNEIAKTQFFKKRFPGLQGLISKGNLSLAEGIQGFLEYEAGLKNSLSSFGLQPGKVTPEIVGGLLKKGHSINVVQQAMATFERMKNYRPALSAFNQVLVSQGKDPVKTLQDMFDFMQGNASSDVYDLWEASSVSEAAAAAGLGDIFTAEDAMRFAVETEGNTTLADATGAFQTAAQMLLRLRHEVDVNKFGIDQEDIIDLSLGRTPRSGMSMADLQDNINRAVSSAQASLQGRAKPFKGFSTKGVIGNQSLGGLREQ